jgi:broad specificity phosphatase PhoE
MEPVYKLVLLRHGQSTWNWKIVSQAGPMWV